MCILFNLVFTGYAAVNIYADKCVCLSFFLLSLWLNDVRRYDSVGLMLSVGLPIQSVAKND